MIALLTIRNLLAHRVRLILTILAVVLGVAFVSGTMIFRDTSAESFDTLFEEERDAREVAVSPYRELESSDSQRSMLVPGSLLEDLRRQVPTAERVEGVIEGYAALVRPDGQVVGGETTAKRGRAFVTDPNSEAQIISGRAPSDGEEVVVEQNTAIEGEIEVGDQVTVVTAADTRLMTVSGIFTLGEDESISSVVTFVGFDLDVAQELLAEPGSYTSLWLRPREGVDQETLRAQIEDVLPEGYTATTTQEQVAEIESELDTLFAVLAAALLVFAGVSVLVGAFIIFNTFTMLVAQRTREMALLRALGASRRQVTRAVLGEALGIGVVGATLGVLVGIGVAALMRSLFIYFAGTDLPLRSPVVRPPTLWLSYGVGVLVTLAAAYLPARRASRVPPIAALRDDASVTSKAARGRAVAGLVFAALGAAGFVLGLVEGGTDGAITLAVGAVLLFFALALLAPALSRPVITLLGWPIAAATRAVGQLSIQNAIRNPSRTAATASALMVGLALVSFATVVADSLGASADRRLDEQFGADYILDPQGLTGFDRDAVAAVEEVDGVRDVTPLTIGSISLNGDETPVVAADAEALSVPASLTAVDGSLSLGPQDALVSEAYAEGNTLQVRDEIDVLYPDGESATLRITGIFGPTEVLDVQVIVEPTSYMERVDSDLYSRAYIDLDDEVEGAPDGVRAALEPFPEVRLLDRQDAKDEARGTFDQALDAITVLLLLSVLVAAIGIINTLGLSVVERTREIGLLRAVGMSRGEVKAMIRWESLVIGLFGAILGLVYGVGVGVGVQRVLASDGIEALSVAPVRLGLFLVGTVILALLASLWPAWQASRLAVLDAIGTT